MTKLFEIVGVERRFALSARLDSDLNGTPPLAGYIMQTSVRKALESMLDGLSDGSRRAFTWTGPYGGGKSCAALLVANLVAGSKQQRAVAEKIVGPELASSFSEAFPGRGRKWDVLALTGRRARLSEALVDAASEAYNWDEALILAAKADYRVLINQLDAVAQNRGGLLIVIDELGKFLEYAIGVDGDVHILQDLAERAARSDGRFVVVGILHQSFEQYAGRLGRTGRDEWAKVQGRFQNVPFVAQPDEIAALLARAINTEVIPPEAERLAQRVASTIAKRRPVDTGMLSRVLADAWPLHPVTTLLLGPVSRQRFAQNERSVFGFLTSAEPFGFQSHLAHAQVGPEALYGPDQLWDYLIANFGTALSAGPDGNRMTLAIEAVERAAVQGHLAAYLTKCAAIIEMFRNGSGLAVTDDVLRLCATSASDEDVERALDDLVGRAILIRQPRLGGYALFAGSDFDLDEALTKAGNKLDADALLDIPSRLGVGPIAAKSHYFATGALRVLDVLLQFADQVPADPTEWADKAAATLASRMSKASGVIILLVPDGRSFEAEPGKAANALALALADAGLSGAVAVTECAHLLRQHATDLYAIDQIEASHPRLEGDRIARRELNARRAQIIDGIRSELLEAFTASRWYDAAGLRTELDGRGLSTVASALCKSAYEFAPVVKSELLYRDRPSSSAMAGLRALIHAMVEHPEVENLGIQNYPVERGHYITVLQGLGLHRQIDHGVWGFVDPDDKANGSSLKRAWELLAAKKVQLGELFDTWSARPYGIKRGVMPVLALAYVLANRKRVAVYVDGAYQAVVDDVVADRLLQSPAAVELVRISRSKQDQEFVRQLATLLATDRKPVEEEALPVAAALFQRFHALPQWAQRTAQLEGKTRRIRDAVLRASDPERLLFTDLRSILEGLADPAVAVATALFACEAAYPAMLHRTRKVLADQLGVDVDTFEGIGYRASIATGVTGELRLDAYIMRIGEFESGKDDIEGLASLLVHKPPRNWSDREQEQAMFEMAKLSHRFRDAEAFAGIKGRSPTTKAISMTIGLDPKDKPITHAFHVTDEESARADAVADELLEALQGKGLRAAVSLTALARLVERLSQGQEKELS